MKVLMVSDLHVKKNDDKAAIFLKKFLKLCEDTRVEKIYFLGDIFDHMIGEHFEYTQKFSFFFDALQNLINDGKFIYFFEGNHDFHLEKVFNRFFHKNNLNRNQFIYSRSYIIEIFGEKKVWLGHGDDLDFNNKYYKRWKKIYTSKLFNVLISKIFSFSILQAIGAWASKDSKKRGKKKFNFDQAKEKYRNGAFEISKLGVSIIVGGHTHIPEFYTTENFLYINNGFPIRDGNIIVYDNEFKLVPLESFF